MADPSRPSRTTRYAVLGMVFWLALIYYRFAKVGEFSIRRSFYGIIMVALAGLAAGVIEARRGIALDRFTSFLLYVLCIVPVVVGLIVGLSMV